MGEATQTVGAPVLVPADEAPIGRPTRELPFAHLLNLSLYWLGLNVIWSGLGYIIIQSRFTAQFGETLAPGYQSILVAVPVVVSVLVQPTVATISDYTITRWGRRKPYIFIGALLDVVFLWGIASSNTFAAILAFFILLQCSSNFAQGPFQGYVPDLVPQNQVGMASGLMGVMIVLGQVIGVAIATIGLVQVDAHSPLNGTALGGEIARQAFFLPTMGLAIIEVVTMIPIVLFVNDGRIGPSREGRSWVRIALSAWGTDILKERSYVWLLVSRLFFLMSPAILTSAGIYYLIRTLGLSSGDAGTGLIAATVVLGIATGLTTFPAARLSDRIGRKRTIFIAIAIGMLGMAGVAAAPSLPWMLAAIIPVGISTGAFLAVDWALMTDIIPKATTGRYMGISNVATAVSGPLAAIISGATLIALVLLGLPRELWVDESAGSSSTYYALAPRVAMALALAFFLVSAWALRHVDERRREN